MISRSQLKQYWNETRTAIHEFARLSDYYTNGFAGYMYRAVDNFIKYGPREAAALSYYAQLSLVPLLLLLVVFLGQLIGPATTGEQLKDFLAFFLPGATATELSRTIERFVESGTSASLIAIGTLSWSALNLFSNLEAALSRTFRDVDSRPWWQRRIAGMLMILALGVLLIANIVTSLIFSFLNLVFLNQNNIWVSMASLFVPFGFSLGIFATMYRWIPRKNIGWDAIWPAALLGGLLWELAKRLFGWWLDTLSNLSVVYGSITTVIIFMLWAFITSCIMLLCAEFCVALSDWLDQRKIERPDRHIDFAGDYYERRLSSGLSNPHDT